MVRAWFSFAGLPTWWHANRNGTSYAPLCAVSAWNDVATEVVDEDYNRVFGGGSVERVEIENPLVAILA